VKFEPLGDFLRHQRTRLVRVTFEDIERITGTKLPPKAQHQRAWWSNPSNNVMTKVWLEAGFHLEHVDIRARKLVFRRVEGEGASAERDVPRAPQTPVGERHPLFGALKGLVRVLKGTDLTKPADPSWGEGR
jgi:hypothetical protein